MARVHFAVFADLDVPAPRAYDAIADYRDRHPRILPARTLRDLRVVRGGTGEGTVITYELLLLGRALPARASIREPEPGRVLQEVLDDDLGTVTTFTVDPLDPGRCRVTIATEMRAPALHAAIGRLLLPRLPRLLGPAYREELALLERVAREG